MKKLTSLAASAILAFSALAAVPANAAPPGPRPDPGRQQTFVMNWCKTHPGDPSCRDFERNHHRWSSNQYHNWFMSHHNDHGFDPAAAAIFGFTAAAIGAAIANSANNQPTRLSPHQRACFAKYGKFYNPATDMYKYPGSRAHYCRL
jgi:hypothetical protein